MTRVPKCSACITNTLLDTRRGEYITGFYVRSGLWLDGMAIVTCLGRKSQVFGNPAGGSGLVLFHPAPVLYLVVRTYNSSYCYIWLFTLDLTNTSRHTLIPPRGYTIAGVSGSCASWIDGFGIILTR